MRRLYVYIYETGRIIHYDLSDGVEIFGKNGAWPHFCLCFYFFLLK